MIPQSVMLLKRMGMSNLSIFVLRNFNNKRTKMHLTDRQSTLKSNCLRLHLMRSLVLSLVVAMGLCGCKRARIGHEDLDATLWMQTSAEYQAACLQAYHSAEQQLSKALQDDDWSADLIQSESLLQTRFGLESLPPAIILDVDETVLDNSPYQARRIQKGGGFDLDSWHQWVEESNADPVPGVKPFLDKAREAGVAVFFVTNRESSVEAATRRNLEAIGLSKPDAPDRILSKHERDEWSSDKATRRAHIARHYRILLIVGDDLNDFVSVGTKPSAETRRQLAIDYKDMWGSRWILLPNADYGGWERALYDWDNAATHQDQLQKKLEALDFARDQMREKVNVDTDLRKRDQAIGAWTPTDDTE